MIRNKKVFLVSLLFGFISLKSQVEIFRFKNLNSKNGLSNNWVNSITEDGRGFIWVGTRSGLNVFDGTENNTFFHNVLDSNSLSANDISKVYYSKRNRVIVGTWGAGLNEVNPMTKLVSKIGKEKWQGKLIVKSMAEDQDTILWVGTYGNGVYAYQKGRFIESNFEPELGESKDKFDYCQDMLFHDGVIWVSARSGGIGYIDKIDGKIKNLKDDQGNTIFVGDITCLGSNKSNLLLGTQDGKVFSFDPKTKKIILSIQIQLDDQHQNRLNSISTSKEGISWVSSTLGLFRYDWSKKSLIKVSSNMSDTDYRDNFSSYIDKQGVVWLGNWGNGLNYYSPNLFKFDELILPYYKEAILNAILPINDSITYFGSSNGIIAYNSYTNNSEKIETYGDGNNNLNNNIILGLEKYQDKIVVVVDAAGVFLLDKNFKQTKVEQPKNSFFQNTSMIGIDKLSNGDIWIGSWSQGAVLMNENTGAYHEFHHDLKDSKSIISNSVFCSVLIENKPWIGTMEGICIYDEITQSFSKLEIEIGIDGVKKPIKSIRAMELDNQGNLWIASNYGLIKYDLTTKILKRITEKDGLIDESIHGLKCVGNEIWATTKLGLIRIGVSSHEITNYTTKDGLPSNNFNDNGIYYSSKGILYLCNGSSLVYFQPDKMSSKIKNTRFFIDKFLLDDNEEQGAEVLKKPIGFDQNIQLSHNQNNISFEISIQDFASSMGDRFAHNLEGFDDKWLYHDYHYRQIRYTNLNPGKYTLRVAEVLPNGAISGSHSQINIQISQPFWDTWWFYLLAFIAIIIVFYFVIYVRTKNIVTQKKILELKVKSRTSELNMKNEILKKQGDAMENNVNYASLLQTSLMLVDDLISRTFEGFFVLYRPKDIVSGDFYWSHKLGSKTIFVVADCTGHGVSGAFLSVLGIIALKNIVETKETLRPDLILNALHEQINEVLNQEQSTVNDGMDISVICFDESTNELQMSSAMSSIVLVYKEELIRVRGNKFPIGGLSSFYSTRKDFDLVSMQIDEKIKIYLFTDGYQDQIGEKSQMKFMQNKFRDFLYEISNEKMQDQNKILENTLENWKGKEAQIDDILVVGIEIIPKVLSA